MADWVSRPICLHSWDNGSPEIWDGDDCGMNGGDRIEDSPNEEYRIEGKWWNEMTEVQIVGQMAFESVDS